MPRRTHRSASPAQAAAAPAATAGTPLAGVLDAASDAFYALDREWRIIFVNAAAERYFGRPRSRLVGRLLWDALPHGRGTEFEAACRRAMEASQPSVVEGPSSQRPGRLIEVRVMPMDEGGAGVWLADVTRQRAMERALRAERDRNAEILESISDAFYAVDHEWRLTYVNRIAELWWGRRREELLGRMFWEAFPQAKGSRSHAAHLEAAAQHAVVRLETLSPVIHRWVDVSIFPSAAGLSVYFRDITERKHAEERQRLLVNELNHRVKNSLAVVQAISRQTLRDDRDMAEAREALTARLIALAGAHDILIQETRAGADLTEVIERAVLAQLDRPERVRLEGPHVGVPSHTVLSLSLALHELATNALKYGALSADDGRVDLSWVLAETDNGRRLHLRWAEAGGPPVKAPSRKGFGSRLIERALAADLGGAVRLAFEPTGVVCEIEARLPPADLPQRPDL